MDQYKLHKHILCIDLKSFYASVECALLGLDPFKTPLVVADPSRGGGSVVLAVSPYLKTLGVKSRCRVHDLPIDQNIIIQKPRMKTYLEYSMKVIEIYLKYISDEDLYIYSVDEVFLDLTSYMSFYQKTDVDIAKMILDDIYQTLHIHATCGIGPNMLIAKLALDIESKKAKDFISKWRYEDIKEKLWPVSPLSEMWGIGRQMEKHLNHLGLYNIGDIASYDVKTLKSIFGILGEELYYHTHGIDMSLIQHQSHLRNHHKSLGLGQTLFRDYGVPEIFTVLQEMVDAVAQRLRRHKQRAYVISLGVGYSKAYGGGFHRQIKRDTPTDLSSVIYETCVDLFKAHHQDLPIRRLNISVSSLVSHQVVQYDLFTDMDQLIKEKNLALALDDITWMYGKNSIHRATALTEASTLKARNQMVGGHHG
ncbi:MAG: DNA polymerase thumb domain-containing protein [Acholeplasmataceae bacterium]